MIAGVEGNSVAEEFALFQALPEASKQAWGKVVVMQSIRAGLSDKRDAATDGLESVIAALDIDWASTYRPGEAFFSKLTKSSMLEMIRPALGDQWVENHAWQCAVQSAALGYDQSKACE